MYLFGRVRVLTLLLLRGLFLIKAAGLVPYLLSSNQEHSIPYMVFEDFASDLPESSTSRCYPSPQGLPPRNSYSSFKVLSCTLDSNSYHFCFFFFIFVFCCFFLVCFSHLKEKKSYFLKTSELSFNFSTLVYNYICITIVIYSLYMN